MNQPSVFHGKDERAAFCVFKHRVNSVMAFVMNRNFLFVISAIVLVALAACGKGEEENAAVSTGSDAGAAAVSQPAAPVENTPAEKGPNLMKALRENAGVMTPEEKAAAIERARDNAESAARAVGQNSDQAQAAGEAAAVAAQRSFEAQQSK